MDSERFLEAALYVRGDVPERARLDFALRIGPGLTLLRGPSGAGKTTLLMALAGLLRPDAGRIQLGPRIFFDAQRKVCVPARERCVGLVFQSLSLFPHLSVIENVAFGIRGADRRERAVRWLERMRVSHLERRAITSLSGGEAQRVALARALAIEPALLLLDEPFSALDRKLRGELRREVAQLVHALRIPALLVTHHEDEDDALAENVIELLAGGCRVPYAPVSESRHGALRGRERAEALVTNER
ncbi:MAG TPA: ATP-binding cassette domain-containing protein [Polyangiales bacterium]